MKKTRLFKFLIVLFLLIFSITSCGKKEEEIDIDTQIQNDFIELDKEPLSISGLNSVKDEISTLEVFNVNDFHGAITEDENQYGVARTIEYLKDEYNDNPGGTVICLNGDLFQGSAISNYRYGYDLIKIFNTIPVDFMTLGNHEFDWGLDKILAYFDGDSSNGEANFPLVCCNLVYSSDNSKVEYLKDYVILNKGQYKIGVIGYIGYGLESDIAVDKIEDYKILEPTAIVKTLAKELRDQGCDMIIAAGHDANDSANITLQTYTGDYRIDCILNGHTHSTYSKTLNGSSGNIIPLVQSGNVGKYIGHIEFTKGEEFFVPRLVTNQKMSNYDKNEEIDAYVEKIVNITNKKFNVVLTYAGEKIDKYSTLKYVADVTKEYGNAQIGFTNNGGVRANAFPINKGEAVTLAKVYEIIPFDNIIKTCRLKGSYVYDSLANGNLTYSSNVTFSENVYYIDGVALDKDAYYTVSANSFIFDSTSYKFLNGDNVYYSGISIKDALAETLEKIGTNGTWIIK